MTKPNPTTSKLQIILTIVVSAGWLSIIIIPPLVPEVVINEKIQTGVMAAMAAVLGAVFGYQIFKKGDQGNKDE